MAVSFRLNGLSQRVDLDPGTPLIHVLRNELLLHGAKLGCGQEQCGACLVLIDGAPAYACTTTLGELADRAVETIEGIIASDGSLHPVQQAFLELNAAQCGYCTSGIIMRLKWLLDQHGHPGREQVAEALAGHLCRCGAHPRVLAAVDRAIAIRQVNHQ